MLVCFRCGLELDGQRTSIAGFLPILIIGIPPSSRYAIGHFRAIAA